MHQDWNLIYRCGMFSANRRTFRGAYWLVSIRTVGQDSGFLS